MEPNLHPHTNHLIREASPYLQQHAHNPVDWYPWGEEALERARAEDKPIFLSIGYSTCHWCHVMEKEVFEQEEFAPLFNDNYICIKVDREERPDLDHIYMNFTHALNGSGGWPMNIFLTPDLRPFYAATYIPPRASHGSPGIGEVLESIRDIYKEQKGRVENIAETVMEQIRSADERLREDRPGLSDAIIDELYENLVLRFDPVFHGFGSSPKFPTPQNLIFLLNYSRLHPVSGTSDGISASQEAESGGDHHALEMVMDTMESMYRGGIYDHVGGGLSRYSVDRQWLVPHFEKMLYDNAFLMEAAALGYAEKPLPMFRNLYYRTLDYLRESMTSPEGLYYSAEDADSEGHEGKFYVFSEAEIDEILGEGSGDFKKVFNVSSTGNFEGKNILNLIGSDLDVTMGEEARFRPQLDQIRAVRDRRIRPHRDEKILFSWNAMAVRALALGGRVFQDGDLQVLAQQTLKILIGQMDRNGILHTSMRDGIMGPAGVLDDYAYGAHALLALYEATGEGDYLLEAMAMADRTINLFWDRDAHGFHLAMQDTPDLIMNPVDPYDSAIPSGNGIMTKVLMELSIYAHEPRYRELLDQQLDRFSGILVRASEAVVTMADAWQTHQLDRDLAILTGPDAVMIREKMKTAALPHHVQLVPRTSPLRTRIDFLSQLGDGEQVTLYACTKGACSLPRELK